MVAAAHPEAAAAGCAVLARGGGAVDAAVAVQAVLAVVEPQSSGLAGGTLITAFDRSARRVRAYEGLARAPAHVTDGLRTPTEHERATLGVDEFESEAVATGRAVGVPGTLRVLERAHERSGRLPWRQLFRRAIELAAGGFAMPPYLHELMSESTPGLPRCRYPDLRARYCDGDAPKPVGAPVVNAELAGVLREVRDGGADAFYDPAGTIAPAIVARAAAGPYKLRTDAAGPAVIPSLMTAGDLRRYKAVERRPVCRERFSRLLCTAPPPSFGGVTVLQELGLIERGRIERTAAAVRRARAPGDRGEPAGAVRSPRVRRRPRLSPGAGRGSAGRSLPRRALRPVLAGTRDPSDQSGRAAGERARRRRRHDQSREHRRPPRRRGVDDHHGQRRVRGSDGGARDGAQQRAGELHAAGLDLPGRTREPDGARQAPAHRDGAVAGLRNAAGCGWSSAPRAGARSPTTSPRPSSASPSTGWIPRARSRRATGAARRSRATARAWSAPPRSSRRAPRPPRCSASCGRARTRARACPSCGAG